MSNSARTGNHPAGSWRPGMGSHAADTGYAGPGGVMEGENPKTCPPEAGHAVSRHSGKSGDPTIKDKANRRNVLASAERTGPAGRVQATRTSSEHAVTGRNVRLLPSAHGNGDARRGGM
jgi:hypothetical protein